jgi:hypothetical protein
MSDQISLGVSHEITVGKYRDKAWPKAEVSRTVREDEDFETALSETLAMLDQAINASIQQAVDRIEANSG